MTQTARTYGGALYDLAVEDGKTDDYMAQLISVRDILAENGDYLKLLASPAVSKKDRCALLDESFGSFLAPHLLSFFKILCERGTIRQAAGCIRAFEMRYNDDHGILEATVYTAAPLTDALSAKLREKLEHVTGKTVRLSAKVRPELLGGVKLEFDGTELDGTIRRRLDRIAGDLEHLVL